MTTLFAFGIGHANKNSTGAILDTWFPAPIINVTDRCAAALVAIAGTGVTDISAAQAGELASVLATEGHAAAATAAQAFADAGQTLLSVALEKDEPIESTPAAYLKLHLLSHRLTLPNTLNLDGVFAVSYTHLTLPTIYSV